MLIETILTFFQDPKYWMLLVLFIVEGPITNFIASMFAATGVLNIWYVWALAVLGDLVGDTIYYFIGTGISKVKFLEKIKDKESQTTFTKFETLFHKNSVLSLVTIKLLPISFGLIYFGKQKYPYWKYIFVSLLVTAFYDAIISFLAYNGVTTLKNFLHYLDIYQVIGIVLVVFAILALVVYIFRKPIKTFVYRVFFWVVGKK